MELRLNIPTASAQLTARQLKFISRLFMLGLPETEFLVKAFLFLSGLKLYTRSDRGRDAMHGVSTFVHKSLKTPFIIDPDLLAEMTKQCRFLLEPAELHPLRWIGLARARHFRLYNATFDEYLMAENYYFAYIETKKPEHLDNLVAVLYRKPWHRWNANKIRGRGLQFRRVSPEVKHSVFMWYTGFRAYVPKRCPHLFSGGGKKAEAFNPRNYINGMIHQLSNGDITLKPKLLKQPCWDALDELEQRAIEAEEINK
jgi:hypothetical protein